MLQQLLLWNVINLLDGEASWFLTFLFILTLAAVANHAWGWLSAKLQKKYSERRELIKKAAIQAATLPVSCYIWFVAAVQTLDLISDRYLSESFVNGLKSLFTISAVVLMGWFLLRMNSNVRSVLLERSRKQEIGLEPGKIHGLSKLISVIVLLLMAFVLMDVTGVSLNALIAFGGISGLAVAFASQEIIANFFTGIMIHINQPFALGDLISLPTHSIEGYVEEIGWYETVIRSRDRQPIYVPNALFSKAYVINGQRRSHRRINEKISIRHQDLSLAQAIIADIRTFLEKNEGVDTNQNILVYIDQVSSASVELHITCLSNYVREPDFLRFRDQLLIKAISVIQSHGAEFSIPVEAVVKNI
ncbi:MAG: mechanosensitive ion channel family protein [Verrucomicrobia bacterium]|nr:mechanosensitive ion channel family protein [Verrucomicrobiota bacterium]MBS0637043.1 mechanosensitive ion channel family protein [Verrucomicrobiota bacterium]